MFSKFPWKCTNYRIDILNIQSITGKAIQANQLESSVVVSRLILNRKQLSVASIVPFYSPARHLRD